MNSPDELVSVVIPTFNRAGTIRRAVISVLNQTYATLELIVVDDASDDATAEIVQTIHDPRLRLIRHDRNRGVGAARNTGIEAARGRWIAFQDSDDEWLLDKLEKQLAALRETPDAVGAYCTKIVYGRGAVHDYGVRKVCCVPGPGESRLSGDLREILYARNLISTQTLVARRDLALELGGFDPRLKNSVDWDFVNRLAERGSIVFVDEPLVMTYIMPDSVSRPSRRTVYSRLIVANKLRRRGVAGRWVAPHLAAIGTQLGHHGKVRSARRLLLWALRLDPAASAVWRRFAAELVRPVWSRIAPWRGYAGSDRAAASGAARTAEAGKQAPAKRPQEVA